MVKRQLVYTVVLEQADGTGEWRARCGAPKCGWISPTNKQQSVVAKHGARHMADVHGADTTIGRVDL